MTTTTTPIKEFYLINQGEEHNKFIVIQINNGDFHRRWGRLGAKGQSKTEKCGSDWNAEYEARNYQRTKMREGYSVVTKAEYERMAVEASIVGTSNKCHEFKWVEIIKEEQRPNNTYIVYDLIDEQRLMDPDCHPGIQVTLETRKEYKVDGDTGTKFDLLFTTLHAYARHAIRNGPQPTGDRWSEIDSKHALKKLCGEIESALGRRFS